jgi:uridine kinase
MDALNAKTKIKIEISGPAKSGKSTVAQWMMKELASVGDVENKDDGPLFTDDELLTKIEHLNGRVEFEISTKVVKE